MAVAGGLLAFVVYTTWAALVGEHYRYENYLSPFYSPLIQPEGWKHSPAILILWAPATFRATCYYYRKAYYRALFATPPACAVGSLTGASYAGESKGVLLIMNLHRYALYFALALVVILTYDAVHGFLFPVYEGGVRVGTRFGMGLGSLVLLANAVLIAGFTFGCNSLRHLVGGNVDCFSCTAGGKVRHKAWKVVTRFNLHHQGWAWFSLIWVMLADLYVRFLSMGLIKDPRFF
jgi:hypothetical protein